MRSSRNIAGPLRDDKVGQGVTPRPGSRSFWSHAALWGFVALNCLIFAVRSRNEIRVLRVPNYQDALTSADRALGPLGPHLPPHGWVGYLTPDFDWGNSEHLAGLYRAQYALAPRIVVVGTQPDFVVAVAREGRGLPGIPDGFALHRSASSTVAVYRRVR